MARVDSVTGWVAVTAVQVLGVPVQDEWRRCKEPMSFAGSGQPTESQSWSRHLSMLMQTSFLDWASLLDRACSLMDLDCLSRRCKQLQGCFRKFVAQLGSHRVSSPFPAKSAGILGLARMLVSVVRLQKSCRVWVDLPLPTTERLDQTLLTGWSAVNTVASVLSSFPSMCAIAYSKLFLKCLRAFLLLVSEKPMSTKFFTRPGSGSTALLAVKFARVGR